LVSGLKNPSAEFFRLFSLREFRTVMKFFRQEEFRRPLAKSPRPRFPRENTVCTTGVFIFDAKAECPIRCPLKK